MAKSMNRKHLSHLNSTYTYIKNDLFFLFLRVTNIQLYACLYTEIILHLYQTALSQIIHGQLCPYFSQYMGYIGMR